MPRLDLYALHLQNLNVYVRDSVMQLKLKSNTKQIAKIMLPLWQQLMLRAGMQIKPKNYSLREQRIGGKHEKRAKISKENIQSAQQRRLAIVQRRHTRYLRAAWTFKMHQSKMANKHKARAVAEGIQL